MIEPNYVYCGDCLDIMKTIDDSSIDLIVTSPPYAMQRKETYGGIHTDDYVEWFCERATEMKRILKPTGSFILNIKEHANKGEKNLYVMELIIALKKQIGFRYVDEFIWHKSCAVPGKWPNRFRDAWERLIHFTIEKDIKMNQESVMVPLAEDSIKRINRIKSYDVNRVSKSGAPFRVNLTNFQNKTMAYPSNVLYGSNESRNKDHSAVFPDWIPEFFIKLFTDEGDVVLDPFLGSGTTYRVARRLKRNVIGIEINQEYVDKYFNTTLLDAMN